MDTSGLGAAVVTGLTAAGWVGLIVGIAMGLSLGGVLERVPAEWGILSHRPMTRRLLACVFMGTVAFTISALAGGGEPWWHAAVTAASTGARYWVLPLLRRKAAKEVEGE